MTFDPEGRFTGVKMQQPELWIIQSAFEEGTVFF